MKTSTLPRVIAAFVVAILVATVSGSLVQTHYNLQALATLGVDLQGVRAGAMARDVFSGFTPTYGGYIVAPALLAAFAVASLLVNRVPSLRAGAVRTGLFVLGGYLAIAAAIPIVNWLSPVALLVGASRETSAIFAMAGGGALAGLVFAVMTAGPRRPASERIETLVPSQPHLTEPSMRG